jgi:hypothetical protein
MPGASTVFSTGWSGDQRIGNSNTILLVSRWRRGWGEAGAGRTGAALLGMPG